ncbi:MAG: hypothetical protein ACRC9W_09830 [Plesiomonas sp.]
MANDNNSPKDPWGSPVQMENGEIVTGAPAREYRIKRKGGMSAIIKEAASKAADAAVEAALATYQTEQTQVAPPAPTPRPVRKRQPTANQPWEPALSHLQAPHMRGFCFLGQRPKPAGKSCQPGRVGVSGLNW